MKEAMKLATRAINNLINSAGKLDPQPWRDARQDATEALKSIEEALAKQEQGEPDYWLGYGLQAHTEKPFEGATPLYTTPQPKPAAPEGWKLVPIEPTPEMIDAVVTSIDALLLGRDAERQYVEDWKAMLAAAPQQRKPLMDEQLLTMWNDDTSCYAPDTLKQFKHVVRAIEAAHGIKSGTDVKE